MMNIECFEIKLTQDELGAAADKRGVQIKELKHNLGCRLLKEKPVTVAFPPCSDVLLSQIIPEKDRIDDIKGYFDEYFAFMEHIIVPDDNKMPKDSRLVECTRKWSMLECFGDNRDIIHSGGSDRSCCIEFNPWPTPWCLNPSCVTLAGKRRLPNESDLPLGHATETYVKVSPKIHSEVTSRLDPNGQNPFPQEILPKIRTKLEKPIPEMEEHYFGFAGYMSRTEKSLLARHLCRSLGDEGPDYMKAVDSLFRGPYVKRLFIADLIWLFYFERMGIFKVLGAILDDYATKGKIPMSNDTRAALVMEAMVRQMKTGLSSTVRDRDSSYRRCLGWTSDVGRNLGSEARVNSAFNNLFHKFLQAALEYYKDRRLATAIQAQTSPGRASVATLITIGDTINVLKKAFDPFDYGRNYTNTLNGIVWVISAISLIRELRETLGIPREYDEPYEYIPAAYDLLVLNKSITASESNRYVLHRECAIDARDILLDIQALKSDDPSFAKQGGELEIWLDSVEDRVEGYRTAYRSLTGIDLGIQGTPSVEQQA